MTGVATSSITSPLNLPLSGAKTSLRAFQESDITPVYIGWLNDPRVVRYSNQRFRRHTNESSRQYLANFAGNSNHFLAICDRASAAVVGTLTVYHNLHHGTADIGLMVGDPATWGQGFGLDAFRTVAQALECSGKVRKLTAGTLALNLGMMRILERAGFEREAVRRGQELVDGTPVDIVYYVRFCHA
jgi:ribosomal-protein-alanine N-acetyltransferase